jgi:hypothetical protein
MKNLKKFVLILVASLFVFMVNSAQSQDKNAMNDLDKKQNDIQSLYISAYEIIDHYPNVHYAYSYNDGKVTEVKIEGIPDLKEKQKLASYLIQLEGIKSDLINLKDHDGIYYVTETEPEPKNGYRDLYRELQDNLEYPETAEEFGVEGTVFVKFIVESNGEIKHVKATNNIETTIEQAEEELVEEAKRAVLATAGQWEPAEVGNIPVDQWVILPVQFDLERAAGAMFRF